MSVSSKLYLPGKEEVCAERGRVHQHGSLATGPDCRPLPIRGGGDGPWSIGQVAAAGYEWVPTLAASVLMTKSTTANTAYGAYAPLTTGLSGAKWLWAVVFEKASAALDNIQVMIGIGAAGVETELCVVRSAGANTGGGVAVPFNVYLPYPVLIPHNTRVAAKFAGSGTTGITMGISIGVIDAADLLDMR